jgi:MFS family permease
MKPTAEQIHATEQWLTRRGVPHFIADYNAAEDVLTRALPILTLAFLFSAVSGIDLDWSGVAIAFAIAAGFVVLLGAWAGLNRLRGRRPLERPRRVGAVEIGAFLLVPAALPLVFGGDGKGALITLAIQAFVLGVVYVATSYSVVTVARWGVGQLFRSIRQTVALFARGLPLLLLGFMFLFINAEAWQAAGRLEQELLFAVFGLFALLGTLFVATQIPRELRRTTSFSSWEEVTMRSAESPLSHLTPPAPSPPEPPPLSRREWGNLGFVVLVGQGLRILLVSVLVGAFFVAFGLLIIRPDTITQWTGTAPTTWWHSFRWFGVSVQLSRELVQVAGFLAAFAGLYFSVYTITDPTFRSEFYDDIVEEARDTLAVRALYHAARDRVTG